MEAGTSIALQSVRDTGTEIEPGRGIDDLVDDADVQASRERLRELLGIGDSGQDQPADADRLQSDANQPGQGRATLGDAILHKLDDLSRSHRDHSATIMRTIEAQSGDGAKLHSVSRLLALQFQLAEHSLEIDMVSKGVSKVVSHIDQLTKLQ